MDIFPRNWRVNLTRTLRSRKNIFPIDWNISSHGVRIHSEFERNVHSSISSGGIFPRENTIKIPLSLVLSGPSTLRNVQSTSRYFPIGDYILFVQTTMIDISSFRVMNERTNEPTNRGERAWVTCGRSRSHFIFENSWDGLSIRAPAEGTPCHGESRTPATVSTAGCLSRDAEIRMCKSSTVDRGRSAPRWRSWTIGGASCRSRSVRRASPKPCSLWTEGYSFCLLLSRPRLGTLQILSFRRDPPRRRGASSGLCFLFFNGYPRSTSARFSPLPARMTVLLTPRKYIFVSWNCSWNSFTVSRRRVSLELYFFVRPARSLWVVVVVGEMQKTQKVSVVLSRVGYEFPDKQSEERLLPQIALSLLSPYSYLDMSIPQR